MSRPADPLTALCADVLCDALHAGLKDTIRRLIQAGHGKREIMALVRRAVGPIGPGGRGRLTIAAAGAWCDRCLTEFA